MAHGSTKPIELSGKIWASVSFKEVTQSVIFLVVESGQSLIGYPTSESFGLVKVCNIVHESPDLIKQFPSFLKGIGA